MEASMHASRLTPGAPIYHGQCSDSTDIEKAVISAGHQLKEILCAWLLGEISDQQYDQEKSSLLEQHRALTQSLGHGGYAWQSFLE